MQKWTQRENASESRLRTFVRSYQKLNLRLSREELNINREWVRDRFEQRDSPMSRNDVSFSLNHNLWIMQRCLTGTLSVMRRVFFFNTLRKQKRVQWKTNYSRSPQTKEHACLARSSRPKLWNSLIIFRDFTTNSYHKDKMLIFPSRVKVTEMLFKQCRGYH